MTTIQNGASDCPEPATPSAAGADVTIDQSTTVTLSRRELLQGLAAGSVVAVSGCATNPVTGRSQLIVVSNAQLAQLSAASWDQLKQKTPVSRDRRLNRQLSRVGGKITQAAGQGGQRWQYAVFDSEQKNAFVLPGRQVGFYRGIMELAENDDQIATVLGHEVGHVTGRHSAERVSQTIVSQVGLTAVNVALAANDVKYGGQISAALGVGVQFGILLPYSRRHELEADKLGVNYMIAAGYNPRQSVRFWERMAAESRGKPRPPEFLSTHPSPETRIAELDAYIRRRGY